MDLFVFRLFAGNEKTHNMTVPSFNLRNCSLNAIFATYEFRIFFSQDAKYVILRGKLMSNMTKMAHYENIAIEF